MINEFTAIFTGAKPSNFVIDGQTFDSTKVYIKLPIHDGCGYATVEYDWQDHKNFAKLKDVPADSQVLLRVETVTTGKGRRKEILKDVIVKPTKNG